MFVSQKSIGRHSKKYGTPPESGKETQNVPFFFFLYIFRVRLRIFASIKAFSFYLVEFPIQKYFGLLRCVIGSYYDSFLAENPLFCGFLHNGPKFFAVEKRKKVG